MCLAIPLKIRSIISQDKAIAEQGAGDLLIDISLLDGPKPGDFVIVHAGYAIEVLEETEAAERLLMFQELESGHDAQ